MTQNFLTEFICGGKMELLKELLSIPSPSGEEKEIGNFLVDRLKASFEVTEQNVNNNFNILATVGSPKILLQTHIDTVTKELKIKEDEEFIYGRGACDTKGVIACMVEAAEEAVKQGIKDFGLLFTVQEETDFAGIKEAVKLVNPEVVVVGEPTDFKLVYGQKGILSFKVKCEGKAAHSAMPEKGDSAINKLLDELDRIRKIELPENELGKTTLNIGVINGGTINNVVPDFAEADISVRTTVSTAEIMSLLGIKECIGLDPKIITDKELLNKFPYEKITVPYFTEMYFWKNAVVFGQGKIEFAHSDNEKISKADLRRGKDEYLKILKLLT